MFSGRRARDHLALIYAETNIDRDERPPGAAMSAILAQVESYQLARSA
jgi:hypothetical protein